jgi:sulfate/thiosulfate transport system ATP-binding protein
MSIVIDNLVKRYGGNAIVDGVSLEVQQGELFVLLGASGSGKSTILRLIAGLVPVDSGRIVLEGKDVTSLPPQERGCGFVFQNYSIFRHMSIAENIELGMKIRKVPEAERVRRRDELLDVVGLSGMSERHAGQLSGGQQQRVALARALAYEPAVLLLDEPFGALDVKIRAQLRRTLQDLRQRMRVTTILVTHDQEEAFDLADRIGIIERGELLEVGSPEELYARPRTLFTATFLGGGNVIVGRAKDGVVKIGDVTIPAPASDETERNVEILIRPEHVVFSSEKPPPDCNVLGEGAIVERSFAGINRRFRARLSRPPLVRQIRPTVPFGEDAMLIDFVTPADQAPSTDRVWIGFKHSHVIEESHPQLLVLADPDAPPGALQVARELMYALRAQPTLLAVADEAAVVEQVRAAAKARAEEAGFGAIEPRVRLGSPLEQLHIEQAEQVYDFTVLAGSDLAHNPSRLTRQVVALLERMRNPLLVVKGQATSLRRILVCTAAGEPGKADVMGAGRLARKLGASVGLVYVLTNSGTLSESARAHLLRAERALKALDVPVAISTRSAASAARGILDEARAGDYDLIVVGEHQPRLRWLMRGDNVALQVCAAADRSVLVLKDELD